MHTKPILVVGATGKTGSRIAGALERQGRTVRRGSRNAALPFDWTAPDTWPAILDGVGRAYITYYPDLAVPGAVEAVAAFTKEAKAAGVERLVLLSGRGEYHAQQGEEVIRNSGLDYTLLRSAWFAQNFSEGELRAPVLAGVLPMPGGDIREPILDIDDLAEVAVKALTEPGHSQTLYELTGPRLMSFAEMAAALSQAIGRPVQHLPISFETFQEEVARSAGAELGQIIADIARETFDGRNAYVTDGVEQALGRKPRDFNSFATQAARAGAWPAAA